MSDKPSKPTIIYVNGCTVGTVQAWNPTESRDVKPVCELSTEQPEQSVTGKSVYELKVERCVIHVDNLAKALG